MGEGERSELVGGDGMGEGERSELVGRADQGVKVRRRSHA
jgi:hypothetical protein